MQRRVAIVLALGLTACQGDCGETRAPQGPDAGPAQTASATPTAVDTAPQVPPPDDVGSAPPDAARTASGIASRQLRAGSGEHPRAFDLVRIHYTGWTTDGRTFDSTRARGVPAEVPLDQAIAGFREGIPLMRLHEQRRFWIPGHLAYEGRKGWPQGMLVFDIELLDVEKRREPAATPDDVSAPPAQATKTASGLTYLILKKGKGKEHPGSHDLVTVRYTGWTANGTMFDDSDKRGMPPTLPLSRTVRGWAEGLQLMVVGEKRRLWIPPELAYQGREGPQGMLVYDMELLEIRPAPQAVEARGSAREQNLSASGADVDGKAPTQHRATKPTPSDPPISLASP